MDMGRWAGPPVWGVGVEGRQMGETPVGRWVGGTPSGGVMSMRAGPGLVGDTQAFLPMSCSQCPGP